MSLTRLVVILAYNEAGSIQKVVKDVQQVLPTADVLVVDDGSRDKTASLAEAAGAFVIRHPINLCVGGAFQTGLKFAVQHNYNVIMRVDGDGQHNPTDLLNLERALTQQNADVVVGSRFLTKSGAQPATRLRHIGIVIYAMLVSLLTRRRATDTTSGLFCMTLRAAHTLSQYVPQDYPEVEGRLILHKAGLRVVEVPVAMQPRITGVSSIGRWRSIYYAIKVSIAVILASVKNIPSSADTNLR